MNRKRLLRQYAIGAPADAVEHDRRVFGEAVFGTENRFHLFMYLSTEGHNVDFCAADIGEATGYTNCRPELIRLERCGLIEEVCVLGEGDDTVRRRLVDGRVHNTRPDDRGIYYRLVSSDPFWAYMTTFRLVLLDYRAIEARRHSMSETITDLQSLAAELQADRDVMRKVPVNGGGVD